LTIRLIDLFEAAGHTVIYTRRWHTNVSLRERANIVNLSKCDLFISLHCNSFSSPGVHGLEIFNSPGNAFGND
jgi:N-acetylmuramoyl-L-alanine amidase